MRMLKYILPTVLVIVLIVLSQTELMAQCPMCRMTAESNMQHGGGSEGRGLNNGILYMLLTPYILIGGLGYWWWRNRKKEKEVGLESQ